MQNDHELKFLFNRNVPECGNNKITNVDGQLLR